MTLGSAIAYFRKKKELTQEALAQKLDVTNQAVSKWETDQCCPDTMLLPRLADVLGVTIDCLFGREPSSPDSLPWEKDEAFHVVLYHGHELIGEHPAGERLTFCYEGPAKDIYCSLNLSCGNVAGSVHAKGDVECGNVGGNAESAGGYVECGNVGGNLTAGGYAECGDVGGSVTAGGYVECGAVDGNVAAGSYVEYSSRNRAPEGDKQGGKSFHFRFDTP